MYVATRDRIKKNNKLSKVDWGITIINTKKNILLQNRIMKKNQAFYYFYFQIKKYTVSFKNHKQKLFKIFKFKDI